MPLVVVELKPLVACDGCSFSTVETELVLKFAKGFD